MFHQSRIRPSWLSPMLLLSAVLIQGHGSHHRHQHETQELKARRLGPYDRPIEDSDSNIVQSLQTSTPLLSAELSVSTSRAPLTTLANLNLNLTSTVADTMATNTAVETSSILLTGGSLDNAAGFGICYDMVATGSCEDAATIRAHFGDLANRGFALVRLYDIACPLGVYVQTATDYGLRLMLGINSIANLEQDLGSLISMLSEVSWEPVHSVFIGNELVNSGAASPKEVADSVTRAKGILETAGFTGAVVAVDTAGQILDHPEICETSTFCGANIHAFFDPQSTAEVAGPWVRRTYTAVLDALAAAGFPKLVMVTESGWPRQGDTNGGAIPSTENQRAAIQSILSEFENDLSHQVMLFQAYDAAYKTPGQFGVEPYWGILE